MADYVKTHLIKAFITRKQLLEALEELLPSRDDWFIADEDEGIVKICFSIDIDEEEQTDET